jgi:hypothetical protein
MEFTKEQVGHRACHIRQAYRAGKLSTVEIAQYESLPEWNWAPIDTVFLPFVEAQALARKHDIKGCRGYKEWDRPKGMPSDPHMIYKDSGWSGWSDFLGTVNLFRSKVFLSFTEARTLTHSQGLKSKDEFYAWKRPEVVPSQPHVTYKTLGWCGWGDFLGTGNVHKGNFLTFVEARSLAQGQGFKCHCIGVADPVALHVETFGTGLAFDVEAYVRTFPLTPEGIIEYLDLRRPIYRQTACYGHFGNAAFPWEQAPHPRGTKLAKGETYEGCKQKQWN